MKKSVQFIVFTCILGFSMNVFICFKLMIFFCTISIICFELSIFVVLNQFPWIIMSSAGNAFVAFQLPPNTKYAWLCLIKNNHLDSRVFFCKFSHYRSIEPKEYHFPFKHRILVTWSSSWTRYWCDEICDQPSSKQPANILILKVGICFSLKKSTLSLHISACSLFIWFNFSQFCYISSSSPSFKCERINLLSWWVEYHGADVENWGDVRKYCLRREHQYQCLHLLAQKQIVQVKKLMLHVDFAWKVAQNTVNLKSSGRSW